MKRTKNIFNAINRNSNGIFYGADRISKNLLYKARKLFYVKDNILGKLYNELENKNKLLVDDNDNITAPCYTPFVERKKGIDRLTLYSFKGPL